MTLMKMDAQVDQAIPPASKSFQDLPNEILAMVFEEVSTISCKSMDLSAADLLIATDLDRR